jgi:ABC-2 type transport system ATP-binding protein
MRKAFEVKDLTKTFGRTAALDDVSLSIPEQSVVGLIGRNGAGKTTLLRHIAGLYLPTSGECFTLRCPSGSLGHEELSRIGVVHQEGRLLEWMTVEQHLRYFASFYRRWDRQLEQRLLRELELDRSKKVSALSTGNRQKLEIVMAVCHHPDLLLLDEPVASMDPIVREQFLLFLLELFQEDANTTVISSHLLQDVEKVIDWVVCLDEGHLTVSASLDDLKESYAEWMVTSPAGTLPEPIRDDFVLRYEGNRFEAHVMVRCAPREFGAFKERYQAEVVSRPLNLEKIFPLLLKERAS